MKITSIPSLLENPYLFNLFVRDLKNGAITALPTDTLYGIAADLESNRGIAKIYDIKQRSARKQLILFISKPEKLEHFGIELSTGVEKLIKKYWPGPLTIVLNVNKNIRPILDYDTIGIRIPNHTQLINLLDIYPGYLLTTSCNISNQPPILNPQEIISTFDGQLDWLLDGGVIPQSEPSTVVDLSKDLNKPQILREGRITRQELQNLQIFLQIY